MGPAQIALALFASCAGSARTMADWAEPTDATTDRVFRFDGEVCTAMQCMIDGGYSMCCVHATHTMFPRHRPPRPDPPPASDPPPAPSRDQITAAIAMVKERIAGCRDKVPGHGAIYLRITVTPDGAVGEIHVDPPSGDAPFDACVIAAVRRARFTRSQAGVRFRYPVAR